MTAGIAAKMTLIEAIRQRPASWERSSRSIRRAEDVGESADQRRAGAHRLGQLDAVDRQSFLDGDVEVGKLALLRAVITRRSFATLRVRKIAGGMTTSEISESLQDSATMATAVATAVVRFEAIEVAVEVTTASMPPMSFCDAGLHLAGAGAGEEGDRLPLQVAEDAGAQLVHDVLADLGADPGLDDAECRRDGGDRDHRDDQPGEQPHVPVRQGGVDDRAEQERRGQPDQGGGGDNAGDDGELPSIWTEQPSDAAQRYVVCLRLFRGGDGGRTAAPVSPVHWGCSQEVFPFVGYIVICEVTSI